MQRGAVSVGRAARGAARVCLARALGPVLLKGGLRIPAGTGTAAPTRLCGPSRRRTSGPRRTRTSCRHAAMARTRVRVALQAGGVPPGPPPPTLLLLTRTAGAAPLDEHVNWAKDKSFAPRPVTELVGLREGVSRTPSWVVAALPRRFFSTPPHPQPRVTSLEEALRMQLQIVRPCSPLHAYLIAAAVDQVQPRAERPAERQGGREEQGRAAAGRRGLWALTERRGGTHVGGRGQGRRRGGSRQDQEAGVAGWWPCAAWCALGAE